MSPVAGVDGVPGGWVVARMGDGVRWTVCADAAAVLAATAGCAAVGIDIPLGLPRPGARRACDVETGAALGRARAAVFDCPPRAVLAEPTYEGACAVARELTGRAISLQSFHIGAKIREWAALDDRPAHVVEVHPELAFRRMAPDVDFARKKTTRGAGQRIAALGRHLDVAPALADLPAGARLDDVLDALAAAWSARRVAEGREERLGEEPDDRGRPMFVAV